MDSADGDATARERDIAQSLAILEDFYARVGSSPDHVDDFAELQGLADRLVRRDISHRGFLLEIRRIVERSGAAPSSHELLFNVDQGALERWCREKLESPNRGRRAGERPASQAPPHPRLPAPAAPVARPAPKPKEYSFVFRFKSLLNIKPHFRAGSHIAYSIMSVHAEKNKSDAYVLFTNFEIPNSLVKGDIVKATVVEDRKAAEGFIVLKVEAAGKPFQQVKWISSDCGAQVFSKIFLNEDKNQVRREKVLARSQGFIHSRIST